MSNYEGMMAELAEARKHDARQAIPAEAIRGKFTYVDSEGWHCAMVYEATPNQVIPAEAIEAAAAHMHDDEGYFEAFEDAPEFRKAHFRERAIGILEAAAPHMLAAAWDEGRNSVHSDTTWQQRNEAHDGNPYRSAS